MTYMLQVFQRSLAATIIASLLFVFPSPANAAVKTVDTLLPVADEALVTRGDFLRAAMELMNIEPGDGMREGMPYNRIPPGLKKYVETAHDKGALVLFGRDLLLARELTRGQALFMITSLLELRGGAPVSFTDVKPGSDYEEPVRSAITRGWMEPLGEKYFGITRLLRGQEAKLLLRKVGGESGGDDHIQTNVPDLQDQHETQIIRIELQQKEGRPLPKTGILEKVWELLNEDFLYSDRINPDDAAYSAAQGLAESLKDPYTSFLPPKKSQNLQSQIQGEVSGIGAQVELRDDVLTIVAPLRGSPAEKSGLKSGDQIIQADGVDLKGMDFQDAVDRVRGPKGSTVVLTIMRDGVKITVSVVRDVVKVAEVEITWQGRVAVVRIVQFGRITQDELRKHMEVVQTQNPSGVIVDLRNNPGGLLDAAEVVVSNFVPLGSPFAIIKSRKAEMTRVTEKAPTIADDVPMVVLVNEGSASASEIVAAALQDHDRATIVGMKTFGKGTVQQIVQFVDGSSLKMTIAEWFSPHKNKIQEKGVMPDVVVENTDSRDDQMVKAVDLLQ